METLTMVVEMRAPLRRLRALMAVTGALARVSPRGALWLMSLGLRMCPLKVRCQGETRWQKAHLI